MLSSTNTSLKITLTDATLNLPQATGAPQQGNFGETKIALYLDMNGDSPTNKNKTPTDKFTLTANGDTGSTFTGNVLLTGNGTGKTASISFDKGSFGTDKDRSNIHNASGGATSGATLKGTFSNGAKMFGDLNAYNGAINNFTFSNNAKKQKLEEALFTGKIYSRNGAKNTLTFNSGNASASAITAQNNGQNTIKMEDTTKAQTLNAGSISAQVNQGVESLSTKNTITFKNTGGQDHSLNVTSSVAARGGENSITLPQGTMIVGNSLSTAPMGITASKNIITITKGSTANKNLGLIVVGQDLGNSNKGIPHPRAIYSYGNGSENRITLGKSASGNLAHLATADIVAGDTGKNTITVYGDLAFLKLKDAENPRDSEIVARNGGKNEIRVYKGSIKTAEVTKGEAPTIQDTTSSPTSHLVNLLASDLGSENSLLFFSSGGKSSSILNTVEANGGDNIILSTNDKHSLTIKNLHTQSGKNLVGTTINANSSADISVNYNGGNTAIYLGKFNAEGGSNSIIKSFKDNPEALLTKGVELLLKPNEISTHYKGQYQKVILQSSTGQDPFLRVQASNTTNALVITGLAQGDLTFKDTTTPTLTTLTLKLNDNSAFVGTINSTNSSPARTANNPSINLGKGSKLVLTDTTTLNTLTLTQDTPSQPKENLLAGSLGLGRTVIDLATGGAIDTSKVLTGGRNSRTLTMTTLTPTGANPLLRLGVQGVGNADKIVVSTQMSENFTADVQVFLDPSLLNHDFSKDAIPTHIFGVKNDNSKTITLNSQSAQTGFIEYKVDITEEKSDADTKYRLGKISEQKIAEDSLKYTNSIMGLNYSVFMQNLNSLNKRMGELRDNPLNNGVWARIYGGAIENAMEYIPVEVGYVNIQGGYDYAFALENAKNYLGLALNYGHAFSDSKEVQGKFSTLGYKGDTDIIEMAIYNSYIQDEGWFSDSIVKFAYILSTFDINNIAKKSNINNIAFALSEEFGYRFKLGEQKQWFIDPRGEFAFGYLNTTNFNHQQGAQTLLGSLDNIPTFRSKIGSDFGYTLKYEKSQYDFKLGLSYEYDINSADAHFKISNSPLSKTLKDTIVSDGRVVLNLGSNMDFGNNIRAYFDFETSFAGKINTLYQLNAGVRYSFGEKQNQNPQTVEKQESAPLKIEEKK